MQPQLADGPALLLSDIMHTMSPSPAPLIALPVDSVQSARVPGPAPPEGSAAATQVHVNSSVEPLEQADVEGMRARLQQLGVVGPNVVNGSLTPRERELSDMVLRLTSNPLLLPSPGQLAAQAEVIAELTAQRNMLLREKRELKAGFQAEREGWDRTAEALLIRRRAAQDAVERDYETERQIARLQDDNKALKHKLSEAHTRVSALETELTRLRPLLVVQPTLFRDPSLLHFPGFLQAPELKPELKKAKRKTKKEKERESEALVRAQAAAAAHAQQVAGKSKDHDGDCPMDTAPATTDDDMQEGPIEGRSKNAAAGPSSSSHQVSATATDKAETGDAPVEKKAKAKKRKMRARTGAERGVPLLTDARAECLLFAARKIGRMRSGIVANMLKERETQAQRDREQGVDNDRTPTKGAEQARTQSDIAIIEGPAEGGSSGQHPDAAGPSGVHALYSGDVAGAAPGQERSAQLPSHYYPSHRGYGLHPSQPGQLQSPHPMPQGVLYMHSPIAVHIPHGDGMHSLSSAVPMLVPIPATWSMPTTPAGSQVRTPSRNTSTAGPSTPMDSLLSAARSMGDSPESGERQEGEMRRPAVTADLPESPVPKRRRTATSIGVAASRGKRPIRRQAKVTCSRASSVKESIVNPEQAATSRSMEASSQARLHAPPVARVPSALDVLADQAAQAHQRGPSAGPGSSRHSQEPEKRLPALDIALRAPDSSVHLVTPMFASIKGKERARDDEQAGLTNTVGPITGDQTEVAAAPGGDTTEHDLPSPVPSVPPSTPPPLHTPTSAGEGPVAPMGHPTDQPVSQPSANNQEGTLQPVRADHISVPTDAINSEDPAGSPQASAPIDANDHQIPSADTNLSDEDMDAIASPRSDHTTT